MTETPAPRNRLGTVICLSLALVYLASLIVVLLTSPDGIQMSADESAQPIPLWAALLPSIVGLALVLSLPPRPRAQPVRVRERKRLLTSTALLVALAVLYPLVSVIFPLLPEDQMLLKLIMLMVLPAIIVIALKRAVGIERVAAAWRWWAPAIVIVVWTALSQMMPWSQRFDPSGYDVAFIIVGAVATAITAGIGEELFYRRWLQTRLEALLGSWSAIGLASLAYALMHFSTHFTGDLIVDTAAMIVYQGAFGVFLGAMWMRYRNLLAIILVHLIVNGWGIMVALLT